MDTDMCDEAMWDDIPESVLNELYQSFSITTHFPRGYSDPSSEYHANVEKLPGLFEELPSCASIPAQSSAALVMPQIPKQEPQTMVEENFVKVVNLISAFNTHIPEYQQMMETIQQDLARHQNHMEEVVKPLQEQFVKDVTSAREAAAELAHVQKTSLLSPLQLHQTFSFFHTLANHELIVQFFQSELSALLEGGPLQERLLVIKECPLSQVVFKGKILEDRIVVELITSLPDSLQQAQKDVKVIATVYTDDNAPAKGKTVLTSNESEVTADRTAIFPRIKAEISSRMSVVHLFFELRNKKNKVLCTTSHDPRVIPCFVAITNESQWCEAQGKLITRDCFLASNGEVPWVWYANIIHHHFLKASRQDLLNFARRILPHEFEYLHVKYFNRAALITPTLSNGFWNWLGPVTCALRFKRHINTLWFSGLIYGLISKNDCETVLSQQKLGTFIVRFSESYPGFFAVSYVANTPTDGECVMHYLVDHTDIGSQKTLPDFLRTKDQFQHIAQLTPNTGQLTCVSKDSALGQYYSKGKFLGPGKREGYSPLNPF